MKISVSNIDDWDIDDDHILPLINATDLDLPLSLQSLPEVFRN